MGIDSSRIYVLSIQELRTAAQASEARAAELEPLRTKHTDLETSHQAALHQVSNLQAQLLAASQADSDAAATAKAAQADAAARAEKAEQAAAQAQEEVLAKDWQIEDFRTTVEALKVEMKGYEEGKEKLRMLEEEVKRVNEDGERVRGELEVERAEKKALEQYVWPSLPTHFIGFLWGQTWPRVGSAGEAHIGSAGESLPSTRRTSRTDEAIPSRSGAEVLAK